MYYVSDATGMRHDLDSMKYHQRILSIFSNVTSGKVTMMCNSTDVSVYHNVLTIVNPSSTNPVDFAVVTKPLFGEINDTSVPYFIEWLELNLLFGVKEIHIYNSSLHLGSCAMKIFEHYINNRLLFVHQYNPIASFKINTKEEFHACELLGLVALAEALVTLHKRVQYLVIIDLDELIVPRIHSTYQDMMHYVRQTSPQHENYASLAFVPAGFYLDQPPDLNQPAFFKTLRYRQRTIHSDLESHISKSFTQPSLCLLSDPHKCKSPAYMPFCVSANLALVHHYRYKEKYMRKTRPLPSKVINDDIMLKFKPILLKRLHEKLGLIGYDNHMTCNKSYKAS